ncbi:MAG: hypothetical protein QGI60_05885 [archaeon]|jgi:hypothetical protein|nr:hypothetical protein [archaeon]
MPKQVQRKQIKATRKKPQKKAAAKNGQPRKKSAGRRLRQAVLRSNRLWSTNPDVLAEAQKTLYKMKKIGEIRASEILRIFESPVSTTRMVAKLRSFVEGKKSFQQLMIEVNRAYNNQVPQELVQKALDCRQGSFSTHLDRIRQAFEPPGSFITGITIKKIYQEISKAEADNRPRRLKRLKTLIKLANKFKTEIHNAASQRYHAIERVNAAMTKNGVLPYRTSIGIAEDVLKKSPKVRIDLDIAQRAKKTLFSLESAFRANVIKKL